MFGLIDSLIRGVLEGEEKPSTKICASQAARPVHTIFPQRYSHTSAAPLFPPRLPYAIPPSENTLFPQRYSHTSQLSAMSQSGMHSITNGCIPSRYPMWISPYSAQQYSMPPYPHTSAAQPSAAQLYQPIPAMHTLVPPRLPYATTPYAKNETSRKRLAANSQAEYNDAKKSKNSAANSQLRGSEVKRLTKNKRSGNTISNTEAREVFEPQPKPSKNVEAFSIDSILGAKKSKTTGVTTISNTAVSGAGESIDYGK